MLHVVARQDEDLSLLRTLICRHNYVLISDDAIEICPTDKGRAFDDNDDDDDDDDVSILSGLYRIAESGEVHQRPVRGKDQTLPHQ